MGHRMKKYVELLRFFAVGKFFHLLSMTCFDNFLVSTKNSAVLIGKVSN